MLKVLFSFKIIFVISKTSELNLEQKLFLKDNKPQDHVLSIRSLETKSKMEQLCP
jgi:hypothetical protein